MGVTYISSIKELKLDKKKVFIILPNNGIGGAEKIAFNLGFLQDLDVRYILFEKVDGYNFNDENCIVLNKRKIKLKYYFFIYIIKLMLIKLRYKNDIFLSFLTIPNIVNILTGGICYISVRSIESFYLNFYPNSLSIKFFDTFFSKKLFKLAKKVIAVSDNCKDDLIKNYFVKPEKIFVLPNFIDENRILKLSHENYIKKNIQDKFNEKIILGTISRLAPYKGVYELVHFYSKLKTKLNNLILIIVGDGEDRERIFSLCKSLNLSYTFNINDFDKSNYDIYFAGSQKNPYPYLKNFDIFITNSYVEGFQITVLEAMFLGCRIISSDSTDVLYKLKDINENFEILPRYDYNDEKTELWLKAFDKIYNDVKLNNKQRVKYPNLQNYYMNNVLKKWKECLLS